VGLPYPCSNYLVECVSRVGSSCRTSRRLARGAGPGCLESWLRLGLECVVCGVQVDDLVLLHGVDEESGVYLEAPWNLARVSAVVPRVPKYT